MKIACEKYKITILKIKLVAKHITYFCVVIQSKYFSEKQYCSAKRFSNTEHRLAIALVARVRGKTCHIYSGPFYLANYKSNVNQRTNKRSVNETIIIIIIIYLYTLRLIAKSSFIHRQLKLTIRDPFN